MPWSEFMPLGGKDIKNKKGVSPLALKKSKSGKAILEKVFGESRQKQYSGKNMCKPVAYVANGITVVPRADGGMRIYGTSYNNWHPMNYYMTRAEEGNVTLSWSEGLPDGCYFGITNSGLNPAYTDKGRFGRVFNMTPTENKHALTAYIPTGTTLDVVLYVQVEEGTVATEFEPFVGNQPSPNPDYPQEIVSVGDRKNLYDGTQEVGQYEDGVFTSATYARLTTGYVEINGGDTITFSLNSTTNNLCFINLNYFDKDKTWLGNRSTLGIASIDGLRVVTAKFPQNARYVRITCRDYSDTTVLINDRLLTDGCLQIEKGSEATEYVEPHSDLRVKVKASGKNILNECAPYLLVSPGKNGSTVTWELIENGITFTTDGSNGGHGIYSGGNIGKILNGKTVTISADITISAGSAILFGYERSSSAIQHSLTPNVKTRISDTYTIPSDNMGKAIIIYTTKAIATTVTVENVQIELGSEATEYVPYSDPTTLTLPLTEPLRSIGDVRDEICCVDGQYGVLRRCSSVVFNGSEEWATKTTKNSSLYRIRYDGIVNLVAKPSGNGVKANILCSHYGINTAADTWNSIGGICIEPTGYVYVYDNNFTTDDASLYQAWLSTNQVTLQYELAEPIFEPFADQSLFTALSSYESLTYIEVEPERIQPEINVFYPSSEDGQALISMMGGGNPNLRYDAETKWIQAKVEDGTYQNIYYTEYLPLASKVNITPICTVSHQDGATTSYVQSSTTGISARTYSGVTVNLTCTVDVLQYNYMTPILYVSGNGGVVASHSSGVRYDVSSLNSVTITLKAIATSDGYTEQWAHASLTNILLER